MPYKKLFIFSLFLGMLINTLSAQPDKDWEKYENIPVELRSSNAYTQYAGDSEFDYLRADPERPVGFWQRVFRWIGQFFEFMFTNPFAKAALYVVIFGTIIFVIIRLLGYQYSGFRLRSKTIKRVYDEMYEEDIHAIDFKKEIQQALAAGNFRLAVRYGYLELLKIMADKDIIDWQPFKTNREYRYEIKREGFGKPFDAVTNIYEYVWYGDFPASNDVYGRYEEARKKLKKQIK